MHDLGSVPPSAAVRLQLEGPIFAMLEDWRGSQPKIPSRSDAVRLLLALALSARLGRPATAERRRRRSAPLHSITNSTQKFGTVPATSPT
jgi:hypothetical protein